mgnify:CR=1 FL=1
MKEALIIIDVQNDYFENGKMELKNPLKALENIKRLLAKFRNEKKENMNINQSIKIWQM